MPSRAAREWLLRVAVAVTVIVAAAASAGALWSRYIDSYPPLIRGLVHARATAKELSSAFNQRVQSAVPIGMPEAELRAALKSQSFSRYRHRQSSAYVTRDHVCGTYWIVAWKADSSAAVTEIGGRVEWVCL